MLALAIVGAVALLLLIGWQRARAEESELETRLSDAGLPEDLPEYLGQLELLAIPGRLELSDLRDLGLLELSIGRLESTDLRHLPRGLQSLRVREWTGFDSFDGLPQSLVRLEVTVGGSRRLGRLPASLKEIELPAVQELELGALPSSVSRVVLHGAGVPSLFDLSARVSVLSLEGRGIEGLDGIRPSVFSVSLRGTAIGSLEPLPASLHSLELVGNGRLGPISFDDLPEYLVELSITGGDLSQLSRLPDSLRRLQLRGTNVGAELLDRLPPTLVELDLDRPGDSALCSLPSSLKVLWLGDAGEIEADCLPAHLEDVLFEDVAIEALRRLDRPLRSLGIHGPAEVSLGDLPKVPPTLERLDLSRTGSTDLAALSGAPKLRILILQQSRLQVVPRLPATLETLDLAGSGALDSLGSLGEAVPDLRELNVSYTPLKYLGGLPPDLQELHIEGTNVHDLTDLPEGLVHLTLATGQVESLAGLPSSVRQLSFVEVER